MIKQAHATFFDGASARPNAVTVRLHLEKAQLSFDDQSGRTHQWPVQDLVFNRSGSSATLQYGSDPIQSLALHDARFIDQIAALRKNNPAHWYENMLAKGIRWHVAIGIALLGLIAAGYLYAIPWVGEKAVALIPESYDRELGNLVFHQSMMLSDADLRKSALLNQFAAQMKLGNTKKLHFTVVESPVVNAFALPDGNIVVYTGILDKMQSADELAGLIGHEVAHVNQRHSMKMLCRNLSGYIFISAVLGDANAVMAILADNANTLQSLSFSRKFEREADEQGFKIVTRNQMDPRGMATLFGRLEDFGSVIPEFLSSHPVTKDRISHLNQMIEAQPHQIGNNPKAQAIFKALKK